MSEALRIRLLDRARLLAAVMLVAACASIGVAGWAWRPYVVTGLLLVPAASSCDDVELTAASVLDTAGDGSVFDEPAVDVAGQGPAARACSFVASVDRRLGEGPDLLVVVNGVGTHVDGPGLAGALWCIDLSQRADVTARACTP
jgi:hypothetical protein